MAIEIALERIKAAVGPAGWIADPRDEEPYLVEARTALPWRHPARRAAGLDRGGRGSRAHLRRGRPRDRAARRQYRARRRRRAARRPRQHRPGARSDEPGPGDRPGQFHDDGRGGVRAGRSAAGRSGGRPAVPAEPRRRGELPDRRQPVDKRRRDRGTALRQHPRIDPGRRGRIAGRARLERPQRFAQGQYRLRSETALHRRRRDARHHHRRQRSSSSRSRARSKPPFSASAGSRTR